MESELLRDNMSLSHRIKVLEGQLSICNQKIDLMHSTIEAMNHFMPNLHEKFTTEYSNLCDLEQAYVIDNQLSEGGS